jgi:mannose-6-phosphate isomerase-like protein (cupin superfamily)
MAARTVARNRDEGDALWMLGGLYEVKVSSDESGGAVSVMEFTIPPQTAIGPPPHVHDCAEVVYVLDGRARFHTEGETHEAGPGTLLHFPAGTEETFEPVGDEPLRLLIVYSPGGMDEFFREAGEPATRGEAPPQAEPDLERLGALASKHGLELRVPAQA